MADERQNPFERGPFLQVAALCEKVLQERDGVLSLIRIVDVVTHGAQGPDAPEEMPEFRHQLTLAISLKAGKSRGRHEIRITPELPSGEAMTPITMAVQMEGESRGQNLIIPMDFPLRFEGLHWFKVQFDGIPLTQVPLDVRYNRQTTG